MVRAGRPSFLYCWRSEGLFDVVPCSGATCMYCSVTRVVEWPMSLAMTLIGVPASARRVP